MNPFRRAGLATFGLAGLAAGFASAGCASAAEPSANPHPAASGDSSGFPLGPTPMAPIIVNPAGDGFARADSARPFVPWGFNYDHDEAGRLIEDYWDAEWGKVVEDFGEMRALGANVVRVHLQFGKFMRAPAEPIPDALDQLGRLLALAESTGLYLDLTGLGCYHKPDVPPWYDALAEPERWAAQAEFWRAVAGRAASSPAVFCYDLMNEPVVPGDEGRSDWLGGDFAGKHFVQFITRSARGRPRHEIARAWVAHLVAAIREVDPRTLITVGLVPWSLNRPGLNSGFFPEAIVGELDFLSVHVYPERGKVAEAVGTVQAFALGKPVLIEEMFPLQCSIPELDAFIEATRPIAAGWIGFYWGRTIAELRTDRPRSIAAEITRRWLEYFQSRWDLPGSLPPDREPRPGGGRSDPRRGRNPEIHPMKAVTQNIAASGEGTLDLIPTPGKRSHKTPAQIGLDRSHLKPAPRKRSHKTTGVTLYFLCVFVPWRFNSESHPPDRGDALERSKRQ